VVAVVVAGVGLVGVGLLRRAVVGVDLREVVVVPRAVVVADPSVVDGPLDVVSGSVVVVDDDAG